MRTITFTVILISMLFSACGGGSSTETQQAVPEIKPIAPSIFGATSVEVGALEITWDQSEANVTYEIHSSTESSFTPNESTKRAAVVGRDRGRVSGLPAGVPLYFKLVAKSTTSNTTLGRNSIRATTVTRSLQLKQSVEITNATEIGLSVISLDAVSLVIDTTRAARLPKVGEYIFGTLDNSNREEYLIRVESISDSGGNRRTVSYSIPLFRDLFNRGYASVAVSSTSDPISVPTSSPQVRALSASRNAVGDTTCGAGIEVSLKRISFRPDGGIDLGFSEDGLGFVRAWATGDVSGAANIGSDATFRGRLNCALTLAESGPFLVRLPFAFPIFAGVKPKIELITSASFSSSLATAFESTVNGVLGADLMLSEGRSPSLTFERSSLSGSLLPTITSRPDIPVAVELTAGFSFGVDAILRFASKKDFLSVTFGKVAAVHNLSVKGEFEDTKGFIKRKKVQETQLKTLEATEYADIQVFFGLDAKISDQLKISIGLTGKYPLTSPTVFFSVPKPELVVSAIGGADGVSEEGVMQLMPREGRGAIINEQATRGNFDPSYPDRLSPNPTSGAARIAYTTTAERCAATSVVDNITGEIGRRYSNIELLNSGGQVILDFDPSKITNSNKHYIAQATLAPPVNYGNSATFPSKGFLTASFTNNFLGLISVGRDDNLPFDFGSFAVKYSLRDPFRPSEDTYSAIVTGFKDSGEKVEAIYILGDGYGLAEFRVINVDAKLFRGLQFVTIQLNGLYSLFSFGELMVDNIYVKASCEN